MLTWDYHLIEARADIRLRQYCAPDIAWRVGEGGGGEPPPFHASGNQKGTRRSLFDFHMAEREGFEPDSEPQWDQQVTDPENNLVPTDPPKTP
jgi:hypothetical protein